MCISWNRPRGIILEYQVLSKLTEKFVTKWAQKFGSFHMTETLNESNTFLIHMGIKKKQNAYISGPQCECLTLWVHFRMLTGIANTIHSNQLKKGSKNTLHSVTQSGMKNGSMKNGEGRGESNGGRVKGGGGGWGGKGLSVHISISCKACVYSKCSLDCSCTFYTYMFCK